MRWGLAFITVLNLPLCQMAHGQNLPVIPDGQSNTTIAYDDTGHALVDIAAPVSDGISHNTFTRFNKWD